MKIQKVWRGKMAGPLQGIKVIDITTNISGPSLTMVLADMGGEIIKIV